MAFASRRSDQDSFTPTRYGAEVTAKSVTKAVIPAAGLGTRFLPATKAQPKEMLPVVDRPLDAFIKAPESASCAGSSSSWVSTSPSSTVGHEVDR